MNRLPTVAAIAAAFTTIGLIAGCGGSGTSVQAHVFGGTSASYNTFPSLAYVLDVGVGQCTGTVVAPTLVLTAGHCAVDPATGAVEPPSGFRVLTGNVDSSPAESEISRVSEVIMYPGYQKTRSNDAALLVLESPTSSPAVTLAGKATTRAGARVALVGWETRAHHLLPIRALRAYTVLRSQEYCEEAGPFRAGSEICTESGPGKSNTGACLGDSGGPLLAVSGNLEVEVGIVRARVTPRTSEPCGDLTLSTRVDAIFPWARHWIEIADAAGGQSRALSRAIANADAVNLTVSDIPNATEVEIGGVAPPSSAQRAFVKCDGGVNPSLRTAAIYSPTLATGQSVEGTYFTSAVAVTPTAAMAAHNQAATFSPRGARCAMALEARPPVVREGNYVFHNSRPVVTRLADPLRGMQGISGVRAIIRTVEDLSRAGKERVVRSFQIYIDNLGFLLGNESVVLDAVGQPEPPSPAIERRLLSLLYSRAETVKR